MLIVLILLIVMLLMLLMFSQSEAFLVQLIAGLAVIMFVVWLAVSAILYPITIILDRFMGGANENRNME